MARLPTEVALIALACMDLTSLNDNDTEVQIAALCARACNPHGRVAAVCTWPRLAGFARDMLPESVPVAAVANFPAGASDIASALRDTRQIVQAGAQEVDVVLPYRELIAGNQKACTDLLEAVRLACPGLVLKVILETGELSTEALMADAARIALAAGADFLKTSTGKTPVSATVPAARVLLRAINDNVLGNMRVGFKASGGIRSVEDAAPYLDAVEAAWGKLALAPGRFRIGASGLLNDIEAVLAGSASGARSSPHY